MRRALLALGLLLSCHRQVVEPAAPSAAAPFQKEVAVSYHEDPDATGVSLRLYEAGAPSAEAVANPVAAGTALSDADTLALLARLPPLEGAEVVAFALREGPTPPPRTGAVVPFEPPGEAPPPAVPAGPPTVVRRAPEGDVPMAPHLSVTFDQPMVAVSSQDEAARKVPVALTPAPKGAWRWLGTKTLVFTPAPRFPMATRYTVAIPAGTRSATGSAMAGPVTWTFATPPPTLATSWPTEARRRGGVVRPQPTDPLIFLGFDQAIDPGAVLAKLTLRGGGADAPLRIATAEEVRADRVVTGMVEASEPGRWLAVRPARPLARATTYTVNVPPGTPSAEGPLLTEKAQSFSFTTFAALTLEKAGCWGQKPCPPTSAWALEFNNPLDEDAFDPAWITVSPAVPGVEIVASGNTVRVHGAFAGRSTYTVTVAAALRDTFGQTLGGPVTRTIDVGPADPALVGPPDTFVVVDPAAAPSLSFFTVNQPSLKVTVHRVRAEDWPAWEAWLQKYRWEDDKPGALPGKKVATATVKVAGTADRLTETRVELGPWLDEGLGQLVVKVEPAVQPKEKWRRVSWLGWVQSTGLGVTAFSDAEDLTGWVTRLGDGAAVPGATLSLLGAPGTGTTGADGLAVVPLAGTPATALVARSGKDVAILPADIHGYGGSGWVRAEEHEEARFFVFDDKGLYKPGETVHLRGWIRRLPPGKARAIEGLDGKVTAVRWSAVTSQGNPLGSGRVEVTGLGGFTVDIPLPTTPNLGHARVELAAEGDLAWATSHGFQIEEYRTPEFEVTATGVVEATALGEDATVDVSARYYAGGALPGAPVSWRVTTAPATFVPPGRGDWSFGPYAPWWRHGGEESSAWTPPQVLAGVTDASGEHHLGVHVEAMAPRPFTVTAEATVTDVNRQAWSASKGFLVHPSAVYVGLKTGRPYLEAEQPLEVRTVAVDRDGRDVATELTVALQRTRWVKKGRTWGEQIEQVAEERVAAGTAVTFRPAVGGSYAVVATVRDAAGRLNRTELRVWVTGAELAPDRGVEAEEVTLVPERQEYAPGDTATFLVQAPFAPAEGVLTVQANGLLETRRFTMEGTSTTLSVPITEAFMPDVTVAVDLVGARVRGGDDGTPRPELPKRVAYASGTLTFQVPPLPRKLAVSIAPELARLDPGGSTSVRLSVHDAAGAPVPGAELAVVAVDEAVLALAGWDLPDPLGTFYAARGTGVATAHLRQWVALADPDVTIPEATPADFGARDGETLKRMGGREAMTGAMPEEGAPPPAGVTTMTMAAPAPGAAPAPAPGPAGPAIAVRSDFAAVALWAPRVTTDDDGVATVALKLPDSLTRYRVYAVAVAGDRQFGVGDADVTARLPLMVRPSPPRFLNFGDRVEVPVVLQNQTDTPLTVDVAARAANLGWLGTVGDPLPEGGAGRWTVGRRVTVPANDRIEVRFPAAALGAGTARLQIAAASGAYADAATVSLPVWTPATTEAFATYGTFDSGAAVLPVAPPADVWPQFGGLEVSVTSTQLGALTDAVLHLVKYPYDCNEQLASRVLAVAALRDVLGAFGSPELPEPEVLVASVAEDLARLGRRQNDDGGFAFWRKGDASWPYVSVHAAHAMVRAKEKGFAVDGNALTRALHYLDGIERRIPKGYSPEAKWALRGYALYVRSLAGKSDVGKAKALLADAGIDALPPEAMGWILPTLVDGGAKSEVAAIRGWLGNHVTESAAGAHFVTSYSDGAQVLLHSSRRVDAVLLEALLRTAPKDELVPKLVNGLLAHRKAGKWANTNEDSLVLVALDHYFQAYEGTKPDFLARVWLGRGVAGEHAFRGYTTERAEVEVPMAQLQAEDLAIGKEGPGRLYYRVGLRYAPRSLHVDAADHGFTVERLYEAVDDPADVRRDSDGTWHVKAGARVRVRLTMVTPMRRYHVALVDPLPAGLEVQNPDLATTGALPVDPGAPPEPFWWWRRAWYEHENLRDERVEAFAALLWDGVHAYTYVARATTPGDFVVPPARAEEMYTPETFGRSAGDRVIVE